MRSPSRWITWAALIVAVSAAADKRPVLSAKKPERTPAASEAEALRRYRRASRDVVDAARVVAEATRTAEKARQQLRSARSDARNAQEELDRQRELSAAITQRADPKDEVHVAYEKRLRRERLVTLGCLFGYTFLNGVARRSLSSSSISMVEEKFMTVTWAEDVFMKGFEAFAVGKFLVVPATLIFGLRRSMLIQVAMMTASLSMYIFLPGNWKVHVFGWMYFRIWSAMAVSTMLPFVGAWFPRPYYGRVFALLFSGFQFGYLAVSYYWRWLLLQGKLHWTLPFYQCIAGLSLLWVAIFKCLKEIPPPPPAKSSSGFVTGLTHTATKEEEQAAADKAARRAPRVKLRALLRKISNRWVFWAMLIACAAYTPAVEYSTHVTSYLKEMVADVGPDPGLTQGFVCLQSRLCEGRYRGYVVSYLSVLLIGACFYDRATQLDRAFLVVGLLTVNACCWIALTLAEPDAPAPAWVKNIAANTGASGGARFFSRALGAAGAASPLQRPDPFITLSGPTKTVLASIAGATISLPSCLPFAIFALDFGKEGAAVLSALLSVVGSGSALTFLKSFPTIRAPPRTPPARPPARSDPRRSSHAVRSRGWFGVHGVLATFATIAAIAMGTIMFSDSRKFGAHRPISRRAAASPSAPPVLTLPACTVQRAATWFARRCTTRPLSYFTRARAPRAPRIRCGGLARGACGARTRGRTSRRTRQRASAITAVAATSSSSAPWTRRQRRRHFLRHLRRAVSGFVRRSHYVNLSRAGPS